MREVYEPYPSCKKTTDIDERNGRIVSVSSDISALWVSGAVQLIVGIAYAYDTLKNNSASIDKLLDGINDTLRDIKDTLDDINKNLDRMLDVLNDLPRVLQDGFDNSLMRQSLGRCASQASIIKDKMRPGIFQYNVEIIDALCREMQVELGGVRGIDGIKGMLLSAPYYAMWLSARAAVEKERLRINPSRPVESPWQSDWAKEIETFYREIWELVDQQDKKFESSIIPKMPDHMASLYIDENGDFLGVLSGVPKEGIYRLTCPTTKADEELQVWELDPFAPPTPTGPKYKWVKVQKSEKDNAKAIAAHQRVLAYRKELVSFYSLMPQLNERREDILKSFIEPSSFWQN